MCRYCACLGTGSAMIDQPQEPIADMPLGGLPKNERVLLRRAQLEIVLAEVRYSTDRDEISADEALKLRESLTEAGLPLPKMQPAQQQQVSLNVTSAGTRSEVEVQGRGWQMSTDDGHLIATILPNAIAIQTTRYERWSVSLRPALESCLEAVEKLLLPQLSQRVGLRYV